MKGQHKKSADELAPNKSILQSHWEYCGMWKIIIGQIFLLLIFSAGITDCTRSIQKNRFEGIEIPAWFFSLPQQDDTYYAIGDCPHYVE